MILHTSNEVQNEFENIVVIRNIFKSKLKSRITTMEMVRIA